jgi:hypothetical protein
MSVQYGAIGWNRQKKNYDIVLAGLVPVHEFVGGLGRRSTMPHYGMPDGTP